MSRRLMALAAGLKVFSAAGGAAEGGVGGHPGGGGRERQEDGAWSGQEIGRDGGVKRTRGLDRWIDEVALDPAHDDADEQTGRDPAGPDKNKLQTRFA